MSAPESSYENVGVGDLVEVEIYYASFRGRVYARLNDSLWIRGGMGLADYRSQGFTIRIIEQAALRVPTVPNVPTVPGLYFDCYNDVWRLNTTGKWVRIEAKKVSGIDNYLPFRRILPEFIA